MRATDDVGAGAQPDLLKGPGTTTVPAMDRLRRGCARASRVIHRTLECAAWLEAQGNEALAGIRLHGFPLDTRQRRRVSTQIRRLAWVFVIAFAR